MRELFNHGKMYLALAIATVSMACTYSLNGQQLSRDEAVCPSGRFDNWFVQKAETISYAEVMALRQKRERNQLKITVGMNRDEVLDLFGQPDHAGPAWLDSAETFCVLTYYAIPGPGRYAYPQHRCLEILMNLKQQVVGFHFQEPWFGEIGAFGHSGFSHD